MAASAPPADRDLGGEAARDDLLVLRRGQKVFLKQRHPPGFLHEDARWQGEYHLACVQEGPDDDGDGRDGSPDIIKVLWNRYGYEAVEPYAVRSQSDVMPLALDSLEPTPVQVEDDISGTMHYNVRIVDLCDGRPGEVRVRWDRGDVETVNLSQVVFGGAKRRRRGTRTLAEDRRREGGRGAPKRSGDTGNNAVVSKRSLGSGKIPDGSDLMANVDLSTTGRRKRDQQSATPNQSRSSGAFDDSAKSAAGTKEGNANPCLGSPTRGSAAVPLSSHGGEEADASERVARRKSAALEEDVMADAAFSKSMALSPPSNENATSRASTPTSSSKRKGVLLNGFCRLTPQMQDPYSTIDAIQSILHKAKECKRRSEEFVEALVDANSLLQELLFHVGDRTKFVETPVLERKEVCSPRTENDGNRGHIVRLAGDLGMGPRRIEDLLSRLRVRGGRYSIHDAVGEICRMTGDGEDSSDESDGGEDGEEGEEEGVPATARRAEEREDRLPMLGSRVRTVFEDGEEYEGTISTVHYRVTYDKDGDTETFVNKTQVFENLACNGKYLEGPLDDGMRCSTLELFSGCSLLSTLCKRRGMNVMSVDNDHNSNATVKGDFSSDYVQSILAPLHFDYIHASPVCSTYSLLAGGKHRTKYNYNRTPESHEADAILMVLYYFVKEALKKDASITVTIENPKGWMGKGNIMKLLFEKGLGFKKCEINYCQFGRGDKKPTNIWTNDIKLGRILEKIGGKCNCKLPHEESMKRARLADPKNFAVLPLKLCQLLSLYVQSKHSQQKYEKFASAE